MSDDQPGDKSTERVKIGPHVDKDQWDDFREHTEEKHGQLRYALGIELDSAIDAYLADERASYRDQITAIDSKVEAVLDELGVEQASETETAKAKGE